MGMISIIVLAAGESKRFGSPKLIHNLNGKPLIQHLINNLKKTKIDEIVVVLGAHKEKLQTLLPRGVKVAVNKNYQLGRSSSLKTGLRNISQDAEAFFVLPADIPLIKPATFDTVIKNFKESNRLIGIPVFENKRAHPPIYKKELQAEILMLGDDEPLYMINRKFAQKTIEIKIKDKATTLNINTPADLKKIKQLI